MVYIHHGILLIHKKEWNNAICSNMMDLENIILTEVKSDWEIQISYDITYIWNLKNNTNKSVYKTETDSETWKQTYGYQRAKGYRDKVGV